MKKFNFLIITYLFFSLSSVLAQSPSEPIVLNHGLGIYYTQNGKKLSPRQLITVTKVNAEALKEIQTAKINHEAAQLFGIPGGFMLGFPLGQVLVGGKPNMVILGIGAGLVLASIPFSVAYSKHAKKGVTIYNEGLKQSDLGRVDFNFGLTQHGIGLNMTF
ncbi:MAG: hypothetical protein AB7O47_12075 [Flavobacteriales bacterium]